MKKVILLLVLSILLTGCDQLPKVQPTITDMEMQTKVASILTSYPTSTPGAEGLFEMTPDIQLTQEAIDLATNAPIATQTAAADPGLTTETVEPAQGGVPTNTPVLSLPTAGPTDTPMPITEPTATLFVEAMTATMPSGDPAMNQNAPTWEDTMDTTTNWPLDGNAFTSIDFRDGYMVFTGLKKDNGWRLSTNDLENFYMEMTVRTGDCNGTDRYGLMIRVPDRSEADRGYWYQFSCEGKYAFQKWDGSGESGKVTGLIGWTSNAAITPGSNSTNRLGIMARGDNFTLYANGVKLASAEDNANDAWLKGGFGVIIGAKETEGMTVYVDQIRYWLNPVQ